MKTAVSSPDAPKAIASDGEKVKQGGLWLMDDIDAALAWISKITPADADSALAKGLSTHEGALLSEQVASDLDLPFTDPVDLLA